MAERDKNLVKLAEAYPEIFCRGCLRLGSYCICEEPEEPEHIDGSGAGGSMEP